MQGSLAVGCNEMWQAVLPGRHPNFRMMRGMTDDGRQVRPGAFLRGPALHDLHEDEWQELSARHDLSLIVDFRCADEVRQRPNRLPQALRGRAVSLPIDSGASTRVAAGLQTGPVSHHRSAVVMRAVYADLASVHLPLYADFLARVAQGAGRGVFFHCTAGKDRTGFAAALILLALGIPREQVMADFLASGTLWRPDAALESRVPAPARAAIFGIEASYLETALDELNRTYGSAAAFARQAMGGKHAFRAWADQSLS